MTSDDSRPAPERVFTHPGIGFFIGQKCAKCNKPTQTGGSKWMNVGGAKQRVGKCCVKVQK